MQPRICTHGEAADLESFRTTVVSDLFFSYACVSNSLG